MGATLFDKRERLGDALVALLQEKPLDDISVQEILDRAQVARSTFYAHFSDKRDLLLSDADHFFGFIAGRPVRELFAHVAQMRLLCEALSGNEAVRSLGRAHFAKAFAARGPALAEALAAALFALVDHWMRTGMRQTPQEMELLFDKLAASCDSAQP